MRPVPFASKFPQGENADDGPADTAVLHSFPLPPSSHWHALKRVFMPHSESQNNTYVRERETHSGDCKATV